jgi:uncharacterized glyoxalase superfamily protein PhnB
MQTGEHSVLTRVVEIRIMLFPADFDKARSFYKDVIQWPLLREWRYDQVRGAMFDTGCGIVELLTPEPGTPATSGGRMSMRVQDVHALWQELSGKSTVIFALRKNAWGDDSFCIADPDGFQLIFFTPWPKSD